MEASTKNAILIAGTVLSVLALFNAAVLGEGGSGFWNGVVPLIATAIGTAAAGFFAALGSGSTGQGALAGLLTGIFSALINAIIVALQFLFTHVVATTQAQMNLTLGILWQIVLAAVGGVILGGLAGVLGSLLAASRAEEASEA